MKEPRKALIPGSFPDWLRKHPALQPWEVGKERLEQDTVSFIPLFSPKYYDFPEKDVPMPEKTGLCGRLLACWVYHWERFNTDWTPEQSRAYLLQSMTFCPVEEIVFSEAVYDRQNAAAMYFQNEIAPYLRQIGQRLENVAQLPKDGEEAWMNEFWIFLVEEPRTREKPCVILRYMGLVPIRNWLAAVFTNHVHNCWRTNSFRQPVVSLDAIPPQQAPDRSCAQEDRRNHSLAVFLEKELKKAFSQLVAEEQMRLEYAYGENLSNQEVAAILQEHPSSTTRKRQSLENRIVQELCKALSASEEWRDFADSFSIMTPSEVMRWMLEEES
ncbi:MAG: hypothetical protein Q4D62_04585 [Planctomycetia bacterium]|nr:hypothetical protein [Planctomycetia bacterium]